MLDFKLDEMLFKIPKECHKKSEIEEILNQHPEVRFVSFAGLDIAGNDTDERIPVKLFISDMDKLLENGVQTDGSSVNLPKIAELNNAKVDMIPDLSVNWYVDYNFDNVDVNTGLPVGTLRIPAYLLHNETKPVGARVILKDATDKFKRDILNLLRSHPYVFDYMDGINGPDEIEDIILTSATELEFWVRTPDDKADREELSTSQELKEQYWKRTYGPVRTALEKTIELLDCYGLEMEMGHKEVGGVKSKLTHSGAHDHIMEQLEIDWKFSDPMQASDNESLVRYIVRDVFNHFALNTSFKPKPIEGVAGSGEHTHFGVCAKLKDGKIVNLFNSVSFDEDYLSPVGYGALMGILRNYEAMNPFISSTTNSLERLKPGYEAPVCIVTSLGKSASEPSRNRTILVGLVRDRKSPLATRFELRSPNPKSNTYLVLATGYTAMLDGIKAVLENEKTPKELEKSISKKHGESDFYLEKEREYRSEQNVFEEYTEEERIHLFGKHPKTVWENLKYLDEYPEKVEAIANGIMDEITLESYKEYVLAQWATEYRYRNIPNAMADVRSCICLNDRYEINEYDRKHWDEIEELKSRIAKTDIDRKCLLTSAAEALDNKDYDKASELQALIQEELERLKDLYSTYRKNLL